MSKNVNPFQNAVLVTLNLSMWEASKLDKEVSDEVSENKGLSNKRMARVWKSLLPKDAFVAAVWREARLAREFHYMNTLPWMHDGPRILTAENYMAYMNFMRDQKLQFERAVDQMIAHYPLIREKAKRDLNGMFKESDYPTQGMLRNKFSLSTTVSPLPSIDNFNVDLGQAELERVKSELESQMQATFKAANQELWDRLFKAVKDIHYRLEQPKGRIEETTVDNLQQLISVMGRLNVTGDEKLEQIRQDVARRLAVPSMVTSKKGKEAKIQAQAEVASIMNSMAELMGG